MSDFKPTAQIKWFRVEGNYIDGERALASISGYPESGPEWYCLKQLWVSDDEQEYDEWRDIEVIS